MPGLHEPRSRLRGWGRRLTWGLSLMVLAAGAFGWVAVGRFDGGLNRVDPFHGLKDRPGQHSGLNFLLVGTDRRAGLTKREIRDLHVGGTSCNCTDTMLLLHIAESRRRATLVSIPRDSYVAFPPHDEPGTPKRMVSHFGKINSAYAHGGPRLTVQTVEQATGVHLDHYVEIDFSGFVRTVNALGGVEVCTERRLYDQRAGLDLAAGRHTLDGAGALRYVRARHVDADSDLGRVRRQQRFLAEVVKKLTATGMLMNPEKLNKTVGTALDSVRADTQLRGKDLVRLGNAMRDLSPRDVELASVPISNMDYQVPGWGSTVKWNQPAAKRLFTAVRKDRPIDGLPDLKVTRAGRELTRAGRGVAGSGKDAGGADGPVLTGDKVVC